MQSTRSICCLPSLRRARGLNLVSRGLAGRGGGGEFIILELQEGYGGTLLVLITDSAFCILGIRFFARLGVWLSKLSLRFGQLKVWHMQGLVP